ncbi:MAG: DUF1697 domain-containing protein [Leptospiraceae bacterium]|nr:DUF1697 domain-containing protein [Leptospiraceae bacterium]
MGGKGKLPMKDLSALLTELGLQDVRTYIQSGNVVLRAPQKGEAGLAAQIAGSIEKHHGFRPATMVLTLDSFRKIAAENPFSGDTIDPKSLHVGFMARSPQKPDLDGLRSLCSGGEDFRLQGNALYLFLPGGVGKSRLAARAEALIGEPVTMRNQNTVSSILELGSGLA